MKIVVVIFFLMVSLTCLSEAVEPTTTPSPPQANKEIRKKKGPIYDTGGPFRLGECFQTTAPEDPECKLLKSNCSFSKFQGIEIENYALECSLQSESVYACNGPAYKYNARTDDCVKKGRVGKFGNCRIEEVIGSDKCDILKAADNACTSVNSAGECSTKRCSEDCMKYDLDGWEDCYEYNSLTESCWKTVWWHIEYFSQWPSPSSSLTPSPQSSGRGTKRTWPFPDSNYPFPPKGQFRPIGRFPPQGQFRPIGNGTA